MKIKILSALWGYEQVPLKVMLEKILAAGYDGIDTWVPENAADRRILYDFIQQHELVLVTHQHQASGSTFEEFKASFKKYLELSAEPGPLLINSHTGHDYFSHARLLELIDIAGEFSARTGIEVAHETHRGRLGYSPYPLEDLFKLRPEFCLTADFSHWTCVTESMLEHSTALMEMAISRTRHIHARIGYEEGPQVSDPRAPEYAYAVDRFFTWWDAIVSYNRQQNRPVLTFTTEFGPAPYMPLIPYTQEPVADLFEVNTYMLGLLRERYR